MVFLLVVLTVQGFGDRLRLLLQHFDELQRAHRPLAFAIAVAKKFGDDTAGNLAALVTYYGFLSLFPLLLVIVTVLGVVAGSDPAVNHSIEHSALSQFPVIGTDLGKNIHALHRDSIAGLVIGIVVLLWGAQGGVQVSQQAMADVWNVPQTDRPGRAATMGRSLLMLTVLGTFLLSTTATSGISSFVKTLPAIADAGSVLVTLLLNVVLFLVAFRILTPRSVARRDLRIGACAGGVAWTVLQYGGALLVDHELRGSNGVYGFFGIVLGLMAWIYLGAQVTMYAAEVNVVRARHLWPRSLGSSPLTAADRDVFAALSRQSRRRPEQRVEVAFDAGTCVPGTFGHGERPSGAGVEPGPAEAGQRHRGPTTPP